MALPRDTDTYEDYTDQLVYFSARLAANPLTVSLAAQVDALLADLDAVYIALRDARRSEVRARARRDHQDHVGDQDVRKYRRRLAAVRSRNFAIERIFAKGVAHAVAPRGRPQLDRLAALRTDTDNVLASPQLAADVDADELRTTLETGKTTLAAVEAGLRPLVEAWEAATVVVARARDAFNFQRADGVERLGMTMGELRTTVGGGMRAAYAYTQPGRQRGDDDASASDAAPAPDVDPSTP